MKCRKCGGTIPKRRIRNAASRPGRRAQFCSDACRSAFHAQRSYARRKSEPPGHALHDRRSLALHRLIARKLEEEPRGVIALARANLDRWQAHREIPVYREWSHWLHKDVSLLARLLRSPSHEATRLRQSSPFAGVLTELERAKIFGRYRRG